MRPNHWYHVLYILRHGLKTMIIYTRLFINSFSDEDELLKSSSEESQSEDDEDGWVSVVYEYCIVGPYRPSNLFGSWFYCCGCYEAAQVTELVNPPSGRPEVIRSEFSIW